MVSCAASAGISSCRATRECREQSLVATQLRGLFYYATFSGRSRQQACRAERVMADSHLPLYSVPRRQTPTAQLPRKPRHPTRRPCSAVLTCISCISSDLGQAGDVGSEGSQSARRTKLTENNRATRSQDTQHSPRDQPFSPAGHSSQGHPLTCGHQVHISYRKRGSFDILRL